jgi:hypothetical protein
MEEYNVNVESLVLSLSETPKQLGDEVRRYWDAIDGGFYDFNRRLHPSNQC